MSKQFPVLYHKRRYTDPDRRRTVPWEILTPFEENAERFHGQSLQRLSERGGLGPGEMIAIIRNDKKWWNLDEEEASWHELERLVEEHEGPPKATELEWLRWFYDNAVVELVIDDVYRLDEMKKMFEKKTGKKLPDGY